MNNNEGVVQNLKLQDLERRFSKVINHISSAFYFYRLIGDELIFTGANPAANKIIGILHEELIGKKIEECFTNLPSHIPLLYKEVARGDSNNQTFEIEYREDRFSGIYNVDVFQIGQGEIAVNFTDVTERKAEQNREKFLKDILEVLNQNTDWTETLKAILLKLKDFSGFDAFGIRLEKEGDFPYYLQDGFSDEFLSVENSICSKCTDGSVKPVSDGKPILECTCGMLLSSEPDFSKGYYTPKGSLWTNNSRDFLAILPEDEQRLNPRNTCIHHGYMSILLVPLVVGKRKVGLLQLNSKKPDKLNPSIISFYEEVGSIIGIAYEKIMNDRLLKENEEMFSSFMDHLPAYVYIKDSKGKFIYGNKVFTDGFGSAQWKGKSVSDLLTKEEADKTLKDDMEVVEKGFMQIDENFIGPDGNLHNYETRKFIIPRIGKSHLMGGIAIDVTDQKMLIKQNIENEARWKFALEGNQDGVWDWNLEKNEVFFSTQWKAMLGYNDNELANDLAEWEKRVHPDDLQKCYDDLNLHFTGSVPYYSNVHRVLCKDGSYKWILDRGRVVSYNEENKPVRMIGTHTDLTEKIEQENKLKELNATKDKLFSIIAHDLRNPIGNIVSYSELLKKQCADHNGKAIEYIGIINIAAEMTLILLEDLLIWARTQSGQVEFKPEWLRINDVFTEVFNMLNPFANLKQIVIKTADLQNGTCYADKQMLKTILRNLLQNALKFTNPGGLIEVNATLEQNQVEFTVSDNGVGMDSSKVENLLKSGITVTSSGTSGEKGSGLGLTLCNEFVQKHGGIIRVESEVGKGSRFYFTLPSEACIHLRRN